MFHVSQAPSIWKLPSVLFHDIKDVEDLNFNNMVGLLISRNPIFATELSPLHMVCQTGFCNARQIYLYRTHFNC